MDKTMYKYLTALNNIYNYSYVENGSSYSKRLSAIDMKIYLKTLQNLKEELMNNLNITIASVQIVNSHPLKKCLVEIAINSMMILSKVKNMTPESIITSNTKLFERKNADYGNSFVDFELIGIIVRLNDKINRILNLGETTPDSMQVDEKIEETINDLYNYCVIGLMYT